MTIPEILTQLAIIGNKLKANVEPEFVSADVIIDTARRVYRNVAEGRNAKNEVSYLAQRADRAFRSGTLVEVPAELLDLERRLSREGVTQENAKESPASGLIGPRVF